VQPFWQQVLSQRWPELLLLAWLQASSQRASFLQPLVNLLDFHQVCDSAHIPAVNRRIFTNDGVADSSQTQATKRVSHVLLFADFGLHLSNFEHFSH
jgi:hypothetical protein